MKNLIAFLKNHLDILRLSIGIILLVSSFILNKFSDNYEDFSWSYFKDRGFYLSLSFISFVLICLNLIILYPPILKDFIEDIKEKEILNEHLLLILSSIGAFILCELIEVELVIILQSIGEIIESYATSRSRKSISKLINSMPIYAHKVEKDKIIDINPKDVKLGDILEVRPGEKIPLDGVVCDGSSYLDLKSLTGESKPKAITINDTILSGSINIDNTFQLKVTKLFQDSTFTKILNLVENEQSHKSKSEKFMTKFSRYYIPFVMILSFLVFIIGYGISGFTWLGENGGKSFLYRSLAILLIGCPCSLLVSIPLGFLSGISVASKNGIIIKGASVIENINKSKTIAFDKTGTLTKGSFDLINEDKVNKEYLKIASSLENKSTHPISKSLINKSSSLYKVTDFKNIQGYGIEGTINEHKYYLGSSKFYKSKSLTYNESNTLFSSIFLFDDNKVLEEFIIDDVIKEEAKDSINYLRQEGIDETLIISGDKKENVEKVSKQLNINKIYSDLLPEDKLNIIKENNLLMYVGDGINDSPSLFASNVGISMGGIGSDVAIESSDVIICNDNLKKIPESKRISKTTLHRIYSSIIISLFFKLVIAVILILNILPTYSMALSSIADTGVLIICIINVLFILKYKPKYI